MRTSRTMGFHGASALIVALFIDALGTGLFLPFSLLYFNVVAGLPLSNVGAVLTLATFISLPVAILSGRVMERVGTLRTIVFSQVLQALGFCGYLFVHNIPLLLLMSLLVMGGLRIFWVALPTFIAEIAEGGEQDRWFGLMGTCQNAGFGVGGLLAGVLIAVGQRLGYQVIVIANVCSFLFAAVLLLRMHRNMPRRLPSEHAEQVVSYRVVLRDRPFLIMVLCNIAFVLCITLFAQALPIYVIEALHAPVWIAGALFAASTVMLTCLQLFTVKLIEPLRRTRILVLAGLIWSAASCLFILALYIPITWLIPYMFLAVVLYTVGELLYIPTANTLMAVIGPPELKGRYIAVYEFVSWGIGSAITPAMFTFLFGFGPASPWLALIGLTLGATFVIFLVETRLPARAIRK